MCSPPPPPDLGSATLLDVGDDEATSPTYKLSSSISGCGENAPTRDPSKSFCVATANLQALAQCAVSHAPSLDDGLCTCRPAVEESASRDAFWDRTPSFGRNSHAHDRLEEFVMPTAPSWLRPRVASRGVHERDDSSSSCFWVPSGSADGNRLSLVEHCQRSRGFVCRAARYTLAIVLRLDGLAPRRRRARAFRKPERARDLVAESTCPGRVDQLMT